MTMSCLPCLDVCFLYISKPGTKHSIFAAVTVLTMSTGPPAQDQ